MSSAREEVGRAVRAVQHGDLPLGRSARAPAPPAAARRRHRRGDRSPPAPMCSTSPGAQRAPAVAAEAAQREGGAAAEVAGHVEAAARPPGRRGCPGPRTRPQLQHAARRRPAPPASAATRLAVERRRHVGAGQRDHRGRGESAASVPPACTRAPARPRRLPTRRLARRNDERVHRPRRRHADVPVAEPARDSPAPWSACPARAPRPSTARRRTPSSKRVWTAPARNSGVSITWRR